MSDFRAVTPGGTVAIPGWFGKIPALGDFATRRLPASFVRPWDQWLSAELSEAAERLGPAWSETYRAGPILCFCAAPGVVDAHAWHGTVMPSYDRVGREFPLTLAERGLPRMRPETGWSPWVTAARCARDPGCGPEALDEVLAGLHAATVQGLTHPDAPQSPASASVNMTASLRWERECATLCTGASIWWCCSAEESLVQELGVFEGLPEGLYLQVLAERQQRG